MGISLYPCNAPQEVRPHYRYHGSSPLNSKTFFPSGWVALRGYPEILMILAPPQVVPISLAEVQHLNGVKKDNDIFPGIMAKSCNTSTQLHERYRPRILPK